MIVECPGCNTIFPVDPKKVPAGGVHARCSVCSDVFFVEAPDPQPEFAEAETEDTFPDQLHAEDEGATDAEAGPPYEVEEKTFVEEGGEPDSDDGGFGEEMEEIPEGPVPSAPLFGKRDPMDKAKRLARVLVSDIILYNPDRHHAASESGQVKEEFEEEIQKSWNEYVEQVGDEVANSTSFFTDALNEILAKGQKIF